MVRVDMEGLRYDLRIFKVVLKKLRLGGKYIMVKFRRDWEKPRITDATQVLVRNLYTGICGTDYSQVHIHLSYTASIMTENRNPSPMGHEVLSEVIEGGEKVTHLRIGDRVVYSPIANCESYGLTPCRSCQKGYYETCICLAGITNQQQMKENQTFGGYKMGGFDEYMVGFENQFFKVPSTMSDDVAVLTEPYATALHAVLQKKPTDEDTVIVIGGGIIGLLVIAAIRALSIDCTIIVKAKYEYQGQKASELGGNHIILEKSRKSVYSKVAGLTSGHLVKPILGSELLFGNEGPDIIYDCVGTERTLDDSLRLIRNNGSVVLVGMSFSVTKKVDWSLLNYKEIVVIGDLCYGIESSHENLNTFEIALSLMKEQTSLLTDLVTHKYSIDEYKKAFDTFGRKKQFEAIKIIFEMKKSINPD